MFNKQCLCTPLSTLTENCLIENIHAYHPSQRKNTFWTFCPSYWLFSIDSTPREVKSHARSFLKDFFGHIFWKFFDRFFDRLFWKIFWKFYDRILDRIFDRFFERFLGRLFERFFNKINQCDLIQNFQGKVLYLKWSVTVIIAKSLLFSPFLVWNEDNRLLLKCHARYTENIEKKLYSSALYIICIIGEI